LVALVGLDPVGPRWTHGVKGTVLRARPERNKDFSVQAKCGELIANALFGSWRCGTNRLTKLLNRRVLLFAYMREVVVDVARFE